jgi:hypothetical protein
MIQLGLPVMDVQLLARWQGILEAEATGKPMSAETRLHYKLFSPFNW